MDEKEGMLETLRQILFWLSPIMAVLILGSAWFGAYSAPERPEGEYMRVTIINSEGGMSILDGQCSYYGHEVVTFMCRFPDGTEATHRAAQGTFTIGPYKGQGGKQRHESACK